jgi:hypothetical protein
MFKCIKYNLEVLYKFSWYILLRSFPFAIPWFRRENSIIVLCTSDIEFEPYIVTLKT